MITFPKIATVEDDYVMGAQTLRTYKKGLEFLLGDSHADLACQHVRGPSTDVWQTTWQTIWTLQVYHTCQVLKYKLFMREDHGDRTWHYRIQVNDGSTWYTAKEESGTEGNYTNKEGTVDLTTVSDGSGGYVSDHLTVGEIYEWQLQLRTDQTDYHSCCIPWTIRLQNSVSGWQTPHTFTAATSDPVHFNDWRTDLNALHAVLLLINIPTSQEVEHTITTGAGNWEEYTRAVYRYRPESIFVKAEGCIAGARYWQWRLKVEDDTAPTANSAIVYTSGQVAGQAPNYSWDEEEIDLTTGAAATALSAAGITLTIGNYYRLVVEVSRSVSDQTCKIRHAFVLRTSAGTPDGTWDALNLWEHGDQDLGPTKLNEYSGDLTVLYTGNERAWRESIGVSVVASGQGHCFAHRKRWLTYVASPQPRIHYGAGFGKTYDPPESTEWTSLDTNGIGIPWGGYYYIDGCDSCMETDEAID